MHPMFTPESLYSFDQQHLNSGRVDSFCQQIRACRTSAELFLLGEKAHWFLCAFWHGARDQFDYAQTMVETALDDAHERL